MKTLILAAAAVALTFAATAPAHAADTCPQWRCGFNGTSVNGINLNGWSLNGKFLNGLRVNGLGWNGLTFNGKLFNGVSQTGAGASQTPTVTAVRLPAGKRLTDR